MENFLLLVSRIQKKKKNPDNIGYCYYHWLPPEKEIRLYCWRHLILETQELKKKWCGSDLEPPAWALALFILKEQYKQAFKVENHSVGVLSYNTY